MHTMTTFRNCNIQPSIMHILHANRAVLFERYTCMGILILDINAAFAFITMMGLFSTTNSTYSTAITMENFFLLIIIIKKVANLTEIPCKLYITFFTILLRLLNMMAIQATDLLDCKPINFMSLFNIKLIVVFSFVVTYSACKELLTFWALFLTSTSIVLTAEL